MSSRLLEESQLTTRIIPFAVHEASEYVLGAGLVVLGAHVSGHMSLALFAAGGAWCLLGALSKGRLGIFRLLGRRAHSMLDLLLVALLALSPFVVRHRLDWIAVGAAEAVALILARISLWTIYAPSAASPAAFLATSGAPAPPPGRAEGAEGPSKVTSLARSAGRTAAVARKGAAVVGPQVAPAVAKSAHRLGRTIGAARRVAAERALKHRQPG
jgi:hypothetical protein